MAKKKRKASAFALRVGANRRKGMSFKAAVQAAKRGNNPKPLNRTNPNKSMARKRRSAPRRAFRSIKRRVKRSRGFNITKQIIPIGAVAVGEPILNANLRRFTGAIAPGLPVAEGVEVMLGSFMAKKGGFVGDAGKALATVAMARLVNQLVAGPITGLLGGQTPGNGGPSF